MRDWQAEGAKPKLVRKITGQGSQTRKQIARKRGERKERELQTAQSRSQDDNEAFSKQQRDHETCYNQCSFTASRAEGIAGNIPFSQQDAGRPWAVTDRGRYGLNDKLLARHTQDMTILDSLNQNIDTDVSVPPELLAQGTSYGDGYLRDRKDRSQTDPEQNEYKLNLPVSVSNSDLALGTGTTRSQRGIHVSSSNAGMPASEVLAQEDVPLYEPCHGGENITRDCVPESLDITGSSLAWVPHQRDTSQQYSRQVSETLAN